MWRFFAAPCELHEKAKQKRQFAICQAGLQIRGDQDSLGIEIPGKMAARMRSLARLSAAWQSNSHNVV
jgi:hypothetical protein